MMAICIHCGQENRNSARYCRFCGQELTEEKGESALMVETLQDQPSESAPVIVAELEIGQVLMERYRILHLLPPDDSFKVYAAEDMLRCWNCLAEQPAASVDYCETCGAALDRRPVVQLKASLPGSNESLPVSPMVFFDQGMRFEIELPAFEKQQPTPVYLRQNFAFRSHPGLVRENNEDSLITLSLAGQCDPNCIPPLGFYAVADGVGGADSGEIASKSAVHTMAREVIQRVLLPELAGEALDLATLPQILSELAQSANQTILDLRSQFVDSEMSCTLTAAFIRSNQAVVINVGDSRTYRMRQGQLSQVTQDHSLVAQLVEQGLIQPDDVSAHYQRNVIYRSLGNLPNVDVDVFNLELEAGERLLLCSDGLWEMIPTAMLEEVLLDRIAPQQACDRLVELANLAGGDDNISVIVVGLQP